MKHTVVNKLLLFKRSRSPSWGAWIETVIGFGDVLVKTSLPLVGSVD